MFRNSGAFFIKRAGIKYPKVYRAYIAEYVRKLLQSGNDIEFFIEGTRSRSGKIQPAKFGVLKYIMNAYTDKHIPDALIIPINLNYEQTAEISSILKEWFGGKRQLGSFLDIIQGVKYANKNFGDILIKMDKPVLLSEFYESNKSKGEEQIISLMANNIVESFERQTVILNSHMIAVVLLQTTGTISIEAFEAKINALRNILTSLGAQFGPVYDQEYILKGLRAFDSISYEPIKKIIVNKQQYDLKNIFRMLYYKNISFYLTFQDALLVYILYQHTYLTNKECLSLSEIENSYQRLTSLLSEESYTLTSKKLLTPFNILKLNRLSLFTSTDDQNFKLVELSDNDKPKIEILLSYVLPIFDVYRFCTNEIIRSIKSGTKKKSLSDFENKVSSQIFEAFKNRAAVSGESCSVNYVKNYIQSLEVR